MTEQERNRTMTEDQVRDLLREECRKAGGQRAWARTHDLSAAYVNDVLHGRRYPAENICKALGIVRTVRYHVEYSKRGKERRSHDKVSCK